MNWKLIFSLSLFGLAMAAATISLIPSNIEFVFWLAIFIVCAYIIAKQCSSNYFLHGFLVCLVNAAWITAAHGFFYSTYIAHHPEMASMYSNMPASVANHPRMMMLVTCPIIGAICGIILGLFAFIASKLVKKQPVPARAS